FFDQPRLKIFVPRQFRDFERSVPRADLRIDDVFAAGMNFEIEGSCDKIFRGATADFLGRSSRRPMAQRIGFSAGLASGVQQQQAAHGGKNEIFEYALHKDWIASVWKRPRYGVTLTTGEMLSNEKAKPGLTIFGDSATGI